ncbi:hypothetical protein [Kitasatospora sp. GP82]|uniref:hypothetical protein n=1 Tax=Kitasatospora sp. GP82 TaxID=3035089 RepID=UPI002473FFA3|nr:hypothetical protein [Kitasatospora sp. GP82]MDH6129366.1 hypothetical protein [Kitasatospora sp. GP82]
MTVSHPPGPQGQHPAVWVTQAYPPVLQAALARHGGLPASVRQLVLHELHHRTPAELRERIERRWYARFSHLPAGEIADRADEIALDLAAAPACLDPRCEDGWQLDADHGCPRCRQRLVNTNALPLDGEPASTATAAAAVASIRRTILLSRTATHAHQSKADQRRQPPSPQSTRVS